MDIIFDEYSIMSIIISFISEKEKVHLRKINKTWSSIIDSLFDLNDFLGIVRYASKQLSFRSFDSCNLANCVKLTQKKLIPNRGIIIQLVLSEEKCFLKITSLGPIVKDYYLFISQIKDSDLSQEKHSIFYDLIHQITSSQRYVFHFNKIDLLIDITKDLNFQFKIIDHQIHYQIQNNIHKYCQNCIKNLVFTRIPPMIEEMCRNYHNFSFSDDVVILYTRQFRSPYQIIALNLNDFTFVKHECSICEEDVHLKAAE